ncbi:hypothetical protein CH063_06495 [Colletotrichum higginsianum]|uniref:Uncharacterized protein n=1 Tax=Colletotrichum higginsianum (strain IMI 349063) TaxID=759273 RepID=H1V2R5_COLHI|nr:hypothetical protein CH063_06495 [Colletotrichum higginsianum]
MPNSTCRLHQLSWDLLFALVSLASSSALSAMNQTGSLSVCMPSLLASNSYQRVQHGGTRTLCPYTFLLLRTDRRPVRDGADVSATAKHPVGGFCCRRLAVVCHLAPALSPPRVGVHCQSSWPPQAKDTCWLPRCTWFENGQKYDDVGSVALDLSSIDFLAKSMTTQLYSSDSHIINSLVPPVSNLALQVRVPDR